MKKPLPENGAGARRLAKRAMTPTENPTNRDKNPTGAEKLRLYCYRGSSSAVTASRKNLVLAQCERLERQGSGASEAKRLPAVEQQNDECQLVKKRVTTPAIANLSVRERVVNHLQKFCKNFFSTLQVGQEDRAGVRTS